MFGVGAIGVLVILQPALLKKKKKKGEEEKALFVAFADFLV